jgi:hypothetical protein
MSISWHFSGSLLGALLARAMVINARNVSKGGVPANAVSSHDFLNSLASSWLRYTSFSSSPLLASSHMVFAGALPVTWRRSALEPYFQIFWSWTNFISTDRAVRTFTTSSSLQFTSSKACSPLRLPVNCRYTHAILWVVCGDVQCEYGRLPSGLLPRQPVQTDLVLETYDDGLRELLCPSGCASSSAV